jgi:hypothetical protein
VNGTAIQNKRRDKGQFIADWYCYAEYDVLFASDKFKSYLRFAEENNVWMVGFDGHFHREPLPAVQHLIGQPFKASVYLLGCCQFMHRNFFDALKRYDFFPRFLRSTKSYEYGFYPLYNNYDLSEQMYPTLCHNFGGGVGSLSSGSENGWMADYSSCPDRYMETGWWGDYSYFPVRYQPEICFETENFREASIIHPVKTYDHPLREFHRKLRLENKDKPMNFDASIRIPYIIPGPNRPS